MELQPILDAITGGQWWLAASLALVLTVGLLKRAAPAGALRDWVNSDVGGSVLVLLASFGGAMATALGAGAAVSWVLAWTALKVAVGAAGGYSLIRNLVITPLTESKWYASAPGWLKSVVGMLTWVFLKPTPIEAATTAGNDAVVAKPPTGFQPPPTDL